jgi:fructose/tagatose bisphosphate aldolase
MGKELRDVLREAQAKGVAVGHFNVSDFAILKAVVDAARDTQKAVIVGVSEGERAYLGTFSDCLADLADLRQRHAELLAAYAWL